MAFTRSIFIVLALVLISAILMEANEHSQNEIIHDGKFVVFFEKNFFIFLLQCLGECPSNPLASIIHCRRRVCLPEELVPLCNTDGDCATTHKCCRPLCSCRVRCVEAVYPQA